MEETIELSRLPTGELGWLALLDSLELLVVPGIEVFDVTLPVQVSDGVPAAGAGNLETKASVYAYRFTMPAGEYRLENRGG